MHPSPPSDADLSTKPPLLSLCLSHRTKLASSHHHTSHHLTNTKHHTQRLPQTHLSMAITTPAPVSPLLLIQLVGPEAVALVRKEGLSPCYSSSSSSSSSLSSSDEDAVTQVTVEQLRTLRMSLESKGQGEFFHSTILKGSRMVFPRHRHRKEEIEARAKSKETWRQQLHMRHQQREYDRMVKNVHWGGGKKPDPETRGFFQASLAFNMVAAMATAGFLGYYASGSYLEKDTHVSSVCVCVI